MATCSSCGLTLTWSVAAGAVFYRLVMLKFCGVALMQAASKQQQQQQQQKGQQQRNVNCKFQWHFGCCCALDLLLLLSFCPCVPLSFFGQHCRRVTFEDLLQLWRQRLAPCPPHAVLALCALRFPFAFYVVFIVAAAAALPHLPALPLHSPLHYNVLVVRQADSCRCCTT